MHILLGEIGARLTHPHMFPAFTSTCLRAFSHPKRRCPFTLKRIVDLSFCVDVGINFFTAFFDEATMEFIWDRKVLVYALILETLCVRSCQCYQHFQTVMPCASVENCDDLSEVVVLGGLIIVFPHRSDHRLCW